MNDAATVFGTPKREKFGDEEVFLYHLGPDDSGEIQRWIDENTRNPIDLVRREIAKGGWPMEIQRYMIDSALKTWMRNRILIGSPEASELLGTIEGKAQLLYLSVRKGDSTFTYDKAMGLIRKADEFAKRQVMEAAGMMGDSIDPKSPGTNGSTTTILVPSQSIGGN